MARYSVLRLMIFFGLLCALWLLGLRTWLLLGVSALGSMAVSYFVLRESRAQFSASIVHHLDDRAQRAEQAHSHEIDAQAEDAEASKGSSSA
jgi:hypothetical protein